MPARLPTDPPADPLKPKASPAPPRTVMTENRHELTLRIELPEVFNTLAVMVIGLLSAELEKHIKR